MENRERGKSIVVFYLLEIRKTDRLKLRNGEIYSKALERTQEKELGKLIP